MSTTRTYTPSIAFGFVAMGAAVQDAVKKAYEGLDDVDKTFVGVFSDKSTGATVYAFPSRFSVDGGFTLSNLGKWVQVPSVKLANRILRDLMVAGSIEGEPAFMGLLVCAEPPSSGDDNETSSTTTSTTTTTTTTSGGSGSTITEI